jgi:hypothetical protein
MKLLNKNKNKIHLPVQSHEFSIWPEKSAQKEIGNTNHNFWRIWDSIY